ncbi:hypothetical protein PAXRUDRAFT_299963 [Paxillus rubicundulus Ve08.2h10]|uniref:Unplaced genomic scaffold scaffold_159, whole genome shotgun sequence n=1 Tax=Paxillus rubicundulus Ve08.2h10 TaxID=930991 RepID=A0A0D0E050_9AGAM|nr:hypothetical protein PAXRUDRAFT_299963 [Paxillus rubicundulus Ve08.2h10]
MLVLERWNAAYSLYRGCSDVAACANQREGAHPPSCTVGNVLSALTGNYYNCVRYCCSTPDTSSRWKLCESAIYQD